MGSDLLFLLLSGGALLAVLGWFIELERNDRREVVFGAVFGLVLLESLIYPVQTMIPPGLFHPDVLGQSLRLPDLLIPLALVARLVVGGPPKRVTTTGLLWTTWAAWYVWSAYRGLHNGLVRDDVLFHAKAIVYVTGAMALASGVRPSRLIRSRLVAWWVGGILAVVIPFAVITHGGGPFPLDVAGQHMAEFGAYEADAASIVLSVGVIALVVEGCRRRRSPLVALGSLVLLFSPLAVNQSASLLEMSAVSLGLAGLALASTTWRKRVRARASDIGLIVGAAAAVVAGVVFAYSYQHMALPLTADVESNASINPEVNGSSKERVQLWVASRRLIEKEPILGWGLGVQPTIRVSYSALPVTTTSHNIALDLWSRTGVIGIGLFSAAMASSFRDAWMAWRRHRDRRVAGLALGCLVAVIGVLTKGMVESIFEKYRIAVLLGLLLGVIASAALETREPWRVELDEEELDDVSPLVDLTAGTLR